MQKIGLLGGTFDPVHEGHLQLALAAKKELQLDKVLLLPAAGPPHKSNLEVTPFLHRRNMLQLALEGIEGLEMCLLEGELPTPSYTIDTVRWLQANTAAEAVDYYFIIGIDAFADLLSWKSYEELLRRVTLLVADREGFEHGQKLDNVANTLRYTKDTSVWFGSAGRKNIYFLKTLPPGVSSSDIRRQLGTGGKGTVVGVDRRVLEYARKNGLYLQVREHGENGK